MESTENTLKQLKTIKWLLFVIALAIVTTAIAATTFSYLAYAAINGVTETSECNNDSFRDNTQILIEKGKLDETIVASNGRIKDFPNDENGYWYRGKAYYLQGKYQLAIDDFNKVEHLAPSWKEEYVEPYRSASLYKLKDR